MTLTTSLAGAALAFDLDGTLVDTAPDLVGALNGVLHEQGLPVLPLRTARVMVGRGARALIEQGFSAAGAQLDEPVVPGLVARFIEIYRARIADESRAFEGVEDCLDALAGAGARLVVCTNKPTDLSIALLDALGLTGRFGAVIGPDLAPAPKPDARHLLHALSAVGGVPSRALMIGDSATDIGAASAAGVPSVVVSFGYTEIPAADLGADHLIDAFAQLPPLAARLLG
ncbi:HAD-IA family hydrolase [Phenylobacterium montanum]|uniref:Phosphoglycolate phosphatase n=1 Tax=Phenylobacterium montanum TaxID=2823693 RepID=A0A975G185_9CAUL|nr:HAD-IA family hydrolase [Caulobacter sp. S6]QUD88688.1 HAD-IA family hydrolase [Caulobacter sp. S6]